MISLKQTKSKPSKQIANWFVFQDPQKYLFILFMGYSDILSYLWFDV